MKGRYPVCCLFLEIDPAAVDVNIHPAKREVKFHREAEVRRLVAQAVRQTLLDFHGKEPESKAQTEIQVSGCKLKVEPAPTPSSPVLPSFPAELAPRTPTPPTQ